MTEITEKQRIFLQTRNKYVQGMTKEEAHTLIDSIVNPKPIPEVTPIPTMKDITPKPIPEVTPIPTMKDITPKNLLSQRDINIMAQTFTKCYFYGNRSEDPQKILEVFDFFVKELEK